MNGLKAKSSCCDETLTKSANQLHDGLAFCVCGQAFMWDGYEGWTATGQNPNERACLHEEVPFGQLPAWAGFQNSPATSRGDYWKDVGWWFADRPPIWTTTTDDRTS